ncbi:hypothetical protein PHLGIDRAFT_77537 [Phlebiopsis gigantea 11061_1 CR5-6]|uniref:RlpA-like protein double-psi beta-barrel domain-containing protein n=1 Tax=Phlebiopsis gigantea (strain 11061_1 CR5-6) TaxID=745531 RepID=A0A0C3PDQ5_PHLG1|nr:hypothetical protein PHLGIDRAFT_77537 [Phlebiopsis gigantea 11061_1 CR5-6]
MFFNAVIFFFLFAVIGSGIAAPASVNNGDATFYETGLGACGKVNHNTDHIAAVSRQFFDSVDGGSANPNLNHVCGKTATIHAGDKSTTVTIVDRCAGCLGPTDLDLSPAAFKDLAPLSVGRMKMTWTLN